MTAQDGEPGAMRIGVVGLWHLGTVIAACTAAAGHDVTGYDQDAATVAALGDGRPPLFEPGLEELVRAGITAKRLHFSTNPDNLRAVELLWVTYDTPVDDDDRADVEFVMKSVIDLFPSLDPSVLVLISSQLPIGSTARLENAYRAACPEGHATFAYSPENLRLGAAIAAFTKANRVVVGVRNDGDRKRLEALFRQFTERTEWMSVESAEMTKHAVNAFLATSISFMNELAGLCEACGADAREVERGLKSEERIGPLAYLRAGEAFAGGTLARDISFIELLGRRQDLPTLLFSAVRASNEAHKTWPRRKLIEMLGSVRGKRIAVLGLTYKAGTDTLRRSAAVELCRWLAAEGAPVAAFDPVVRAADSLRADGIDLTQSVESALRGAEALVVATPWPDFKKIEASSVLRWMLPNPVVLDAAGFLEATLGNQAGMRYRTVGKST